MTDSNELIGRLRGDAERILTASGNTGEYRFTVLRESVRQECEECGHKLLGVVRADAVSGARRYYYIGYCPVCYRVQSIVKEPFMTRFDFLSS